MPKQPAIKDHWENVYSTKSSDSVSWFQENPEYSLELIRQTGVPLDASIIDVGGGASTLVDNLLNEGYSTLSVLDLCAAALDTAKQRLGERGDFVHWIVANITNASLPEKAYDVWHDRAVFHFLTSEADRQIYVDTVLKSVKAGGHVIISTFGEDGPEQCSGLPVMRYSADGLHDEFGAPFTLLKHEEEQHLTPFGTVQAFVYCYCRVNS